jgi:hypothetical protein
MSAREDRAAVTSQRLIYVPIFAVPALRVKSQGEDVANNKIPRLSCRFAAEPHVHFA